MFCQLTNVQNVTLSNALQSRTVTVKTKVKQFLCGRQYKWHPEHVLCYFNNVLQEETGDTVGHGITISIFYIYTVYSFSQKLRLVQHMGRQPSALKQPFGSVSHQIKSIRSRVTSWSIKCKHCTSTLSHISYIHVQLHCNLQQPLPPISICINRIAHHLFRKIHLVAHELNITL